MAKIHKGIGIGAGFAYKGKALNFTRDVYDNFTDLLYDASTYGFPDGFKTVVIDPTDNDKFNDVSYKYGTFMYSNGTWTLVSYNGIDTLLNQSDAKIEDLKESTESMEKAVANSLFELKNNTYTKEESDGKYTVIGSSYTKAESDKIYSLKKDVYDKQYMDEKFKVISSGLNELDERCNGFATKADVPYKFVTVETIWMNILLNEIYS